MDSLALVNKETKLVKYPDDDAIAVTYNGVHNAELRVCEELQNMEPCCEDN